PRGLRERLDGHGHLLGKKQRDPGGGEEQQQRNKHQRQQNLAFIRSQVLLLLGVGSRLRIDVRRSLGKIVRQLSRKIKSAAIFSRRAACKIEPAIYFPDLRPALSGLRQFRGNLCWS